MMLATDPSCSTLPSLKMSLSRYTRRLGTNAEDEAAVDDHEGRSDLSDDVIDVCRFWRSSSAIASAASRISSLGSLRPCFDALCISRATAFALPPLPLQTSSVVRIVKYTGASSPGTYSAFSR